MQWSRGIERIGTSVQCKKLQNYDEKGRYGQERFPLTLQREVTETIE